MALSDGPSTSVALTKSSAWVIRRGPLSSAIATSVTGVVTGGKLVSLTGVMSSVALVATGAAMPSRHGVAERHRGVVVGGRGVAPGAVEIVDQRAAAGRDREVDGAQRRSVDVRGVGQELGLRDQARPAVLGDRGQGHRGGHRRVVHRCDVEAGGGCHRCRDAITHGVAERHRGVVVGGRGVAPGAVEIVDQRAIAGGDREIDGASATVRPRPWH